MAVVRQLEERMCFDRAARRDKLADEKRRRDLQELEEKLAVCYVCDNGDYSDEDQIVFCERCCVAVHASCYNIVGVSAGTEENSLSGMSGRTGLEIGSARMYIRIASLDTPRAFLRGHSETWYECGG